MSTTDQSPKPKRHWYQISLKWLMIGVTVVIVTFGGWVQSLRYWAGVNRARVAAVEDAVALIEELGGVVTSEYEELRRQTWLEEQFDDPGDADNPVGVLKVTGVTFWFDSVTDADLECLNELPDLEGLYFISTNVTDAGLEHLKRLTSLQALRLHDTEVTDDGLEHLKGLTSLQSLYISDSKVTEAGLEHLKGLTSLQSLDLRHTNVTDAGLEHLKELTSLQTLNLVHTKVTDKGVKKLQQALPNCKIYR